MEAGIAIVIFVVCVVLVAAMAQSIAGFGFALILMPLLVTVLEVRDAIVVTTLCGFVSTGMLAASNRAHVRWDAVLPLLAGALAGMPLGLAVLLLAPPDAIRALVGAATLVMTAALLSGVRFGDGRTATEVAVGAVSGALNTSTGTNGPPVVLYLQGRGFQAREFRSSLAVFFFASNVVTMASFMAADIVTGDAVALAAIGVPAIAAGNVAGWWVAQRVEQAVFRRLVFALLVASALAALGAALAG